MYSQSLDTLDWIVIGGYFVLLFAVAAWVIMQKQKNSEDYFLAGRNMGWFVVGASIFASNIGSEHVVGLARAVVYTESIQAVILVLGAATLTFLGLDAVGGWSSAVDTVGPEYMNMWRSMDDTDYPWHWLVLSSSIVGIWYWCTDQVIVQRVLTAKNIKEGRRGTIFGAFLKLLPVFLFLVPGVIALVLKMRGELEWENADQAFPALMMHVLPSGLRGLVAAGLMAALMSSLASVFNSCSTLFTMDIYKKIKPAASEKQMVTVGRLATGVVVLLGILWVPVIEK